MIDQRNSIEPRSYLETIRQDLAHDRLEEGIEKLKALLQESPLLNLSLQQSGRLSDLSRKILAGKIGDELATLARNDIRWAMLALLDETKKEWEQHPEIKSEHERAEAKLGSKQATGKNILQDSPISGNNVHIGDVNESRSSRILRWFLYLFIPILAIAAALFFIWWQEQKHPFNFRVKIKELNPNEFLPPLKGQLTLSYGAKEATPYDVIREGVLFETIPASFKSELAHLHFKASGYHSQDTIVKLDEGTFVLPVMRNDDRALLFGNILLPSGEGIEGVLVSIVCCSTLTDSMGHFNLDIPPQDQRIEQMVSLRKKGYQPALNIVTPIIRDIAFDHPLFPEKP